MTSGIALGQTDIFQRSGGCEFGSGTKFKFSYNTPEYRCTVPLSKTKRGTLPRVLLQNKLTGPNQKGPRSTIKLIKFYGLMWPFSVGVLLKFCVRLINVPYWSCPYKMYGDLWYE